MVQKPEREAEELDYSDQDVAKKQQQRLDRIRHEHGNKPQHEQVSDPVPKSQEGPMSLPPR
ncbi:MULTISPECIES: hypothetical protein [Silvimonas]|uniref:hypothetical protein n=1 Tax=Silvimonas TaxID=300264 RepID=UPI0024B37C13|nr:MULTISPECIES: hypothetical protein [Silvimonas]MDR3429042.1 hypothetical protein [Silvimonas sp.]